MISNQILQSTIDGLKSITRKERSGVEKEGKLETRALVNSPKVATYDLKPEMSAYEVCDNVLKALDNDEYGFILVNFANPDMVGHTGVMEAAIKACEAVDECVGKIAQKALDNDVTMIITADHGNAEWMFNEQTQAPQTAHTTNAVPFVVVSKDSYESVFLLLFVLIP